MSEKNSGILGAIVRFSLRFRGIIIALAVITLSYALYSLSQAKYDVFPEFAPPQVIIQTEAPGFMPEQVEILVTQPVENVLNGVSGIESLRSGSILGLSVITVTFHPGSDIYRARQVVAERLAPISGQLPEGVEAPVITPLSSATSVVLVAGLTSEKRSLMDIRTIADWVVQPRLLAEPGVSKVVIFGGEVKQLQIQAQAEKLIQYNLDIEDVIDAARHSTGIRGGGFIDNKNQRITLNAEGQFLDPDQMAKTIIAYHNGVAVTIGDVAIIKNAPAPPNGASQIMGKPGVMLIVSAQYGANTLEVSKEVEQALAALEPTLKSENIKLYPDLFRAAGFIEIAVHNIMTSLLIGAILVTIVIFLFLFNLRTAAISCTMIPLSLLAGVVMIENMGLTLNTITLGGLAIAIGEVVDDTVIGVENILRRLRENRLKGNPKSSFKIVLDASIEVRSAVIYATLSVVLVFIPILTMSGVAGRIFAPLGIAYISAVTASLIVALTLTPAMCLLLLGNIDLKEKEPPLSLWLKKKYHGLLLKIETNSRKVIIGAALFTFAGVACIPFLEGGFLPELKESHFIIHITAVPGTSLQESIRLGRQITIDLLKLPYVRSVSQLAGRAEEADDILGTHSSEIGVDLKPLKGEQFDMAIAQVRNILTQYPGANFSVNTFLTERIEETLSGYTASVVIHIVGNNLDMLDKKAEEVVKVLSKVPGASEIQIQSPPGTPQLAIKLRSDDLERWGFKSVDVLDAIHAAYQGAIVSHIYDGNRVFDVSVLLAPEDRKSITNVASLTLKNPAGTYVRLGQLADIYETSSRYVVLHENARRVQTITCNVAGRDVGSFEKNARQEIQRAVSMPAGMYVEFAGEAKAQAQSRRDLLFHSILAAVGILLLLSIITRSFRNLLLLLLNLPFALVGGVIAVFFSSAMSLGSIVGFVTLFGITLRNSIMMISHFEHLVAEEGMEWNLETAMRGASERLVPILMTAMVTGLGLAPLALGSEAAGREVEGPLAIVILGGLTTSLILNLLVLPTLALRYGRFMKESPDSYE